MSARNPTNLLALLALSALAGRTPAGAQQRPIDTKASSITVRALKSGVFSAFGHDHDISAPIARGSVDAAARNVELHITAAALRVRDSKASEKERGEIQKTMLGPEVLDTGRYPQIVFRSTAAQPAGPGAWQLLGDLTLHGQTRPVTVRVKETAGRYIGNAVLKQTDFGIKPVRIAGGTVRVKNELRIEFDIQLSR